MIMRRIGELIEEQIWVQNICDFELYEKMIWANSKTIPPKTTNAIIPRAIVLKGARCSAF